MNRPSERRTLLAERHKPVIESRDGIITRTVTIRAGERTIAGEAILPEWLSVFSRIPFEISAGGCKLGSIDHGQLTLPPGPARGDARCPFGKPA